MKKVVTKVNGRNFYQIEISTESGYFSITASLWEGRANASGESRYRRGLDWDAGGCMHADIARVAPELQPLIDIHLAQLDGVPVHARENGWYFYSGGARRFEEDRRHHYPADQWPYSMTDRERAAHALHIAVDDLPEGIASRDAFYAFVDSLTTRYAEQAAAALALVESL